MILIFVPLYSCRYEKALQDECRSTLSISSVLSHLMPRSISISAHAEADAMSLADLANVGLQGQDAAAFDFSSRDHSLAFACDVVSLTEGRKCDLASLHMN
jgi:hypothetical protein